jgi:hypothetical protein
MIFVQELQTRQGFSLRTPHTERRIELNEGYTGYFLKRMNSPSNNSPHHNVFEIDKTSWLRFETPQKVLEEKGAETVKLWATTSEQTSFTALRAISAAGKRLSFRIPVKGKCMGTRANLERMQQHSDSGWTS